MTINRAALQPGHVLVSATKDKGGWWIRLRSKLTGRPSLHNHVALFTHYDESGQARGLEGRPGGFGWANLERYIAHPDSIANVDQPMTDEDREWIVRQATAMIGIPYDWAAIVAFACGTAGIPFLAREYPDNGLPSQMVCSSAIDALYEGRGLANPGGTKVTRGTDPDDWTDFVQHRRWLA